MLPIDGEWVRTELAAIRKERNAAVKGRRLELLVRRIFCQVPGPSVDDEDVVNAHRTQEMDLYFFNARERNGLHFLDCPLIIECKGWTNPVDGRELRSQSAGQATVLFARAENPAERVDPLRAFPHA